MHADIYSNDGIIDRLAMTHYFPADIFSDDAIVNRLATLTLCLLRQ